VKDELLDFWDSIPIRWRALKEDKTKLFNLIISDLRAIVYIHGGHIRFR